MLPVSNVRGIIYFFRVLFRKLDVPVNVKTVNSMTSSLLKFSELIPAT